MKRKGLILLLSLFFLTGCYYGSYLPYVKVDTNIPIGGSGVVVTNNIPGSKITVKKVGFRSSGVIKELEAGETVFVRAEFVMDHQEMIITAVGRVDSTYIGSRSRKFYFYPQRQRIYHWDVDYLNRGRY
jgi:hypothetical protein